MDFSKEAYNTIQRDTSGADPLISVYIPCHNGEKYISDCLNSIISQDYSNLEILVVDNASDDSTAQIISKYVEKDIRVKYIKCNKLGVAEARNYAVEKCLGSWIAAVDSDDCVTPDYISKMYDAAKTAKADFVVASYCKADTKRKRITKYKDSCIDDKEEMHRFFLTDALHNNSAWGKLYKADVIKKMQYPVGKLYEDMAVIPYVLEQTERMAVISDVVYIYNNNPQSLSRSIFSISDGDSAVKGQFDGLYFRMANSDLYKEKYPKLYAVALDAVLDFSFFLLGKVYVLKKDKKHKQYALKLEKEICDAIDKSILQASKGSFKLKSAVSLYKISKTLAEMLFYFYSQKH
ncbi:MAG: glycosyltransferase [Lachnospiraceae bacterium]|nr:glycosyltransferase [Lachnospiraceae bacterium]